MRTWFARPARESSDVVGSEREGRLPACAATEQQVEATVLRLCNPRLRGLLEEQSIQEVVRIGALAVPSVVRALQVPNWRVQLRAVRVLKEVGTADAVVALRQHIRDSFGRLPQRRRRRRLVSWLEHLGALWMILWSVPLLARFADASCILWWGCGWLLIGLAVALHDHSAEIRHTALSSLIEAQDAQDIDLLARCLQDEARHIRIEAATALTQILRRLQPTDAGLLSDEAMAALIQQLGLRYPDVILAILSALEQVGDERALPAVERLAAGQGAGSEVKVRLAAEACLPALRERVDRSQSAQGLLRPANATEEPASVLLRPVRPKETAAEVLVRPASGE